jgi:hypothetical protein
MANSTFQNCQRGTVFLCFLTVLFFFIVQAINLAKKRLDSSEEEEAGEGAAKYKENKEGNEDKTKQESENKGPKGEDSTMHFDQAVAKSSAIQEDDPTIIKFVKRLT